jgi:drug/metabolite transporter (DMT)-like permease
LDTDRKDELAPHIALIAVQILFGTSTALGKFALQTFPPVAIVGFRIGGAALAFTILQRMRGSLTLDSRADYLRFALFSVFGISLNQLLFFSGLHMTSAVNTSLIAVTIPIFTILVSWSAGNDRLTALKWTGIAFAGAGVVYLIEPWKTGLSMNIGDILIVINSLFYAVYVGFSKKLISRYGALKSIAWLFIFGSVVAVPLGSWSLASVELAGVSAESWVSVAGLVLFPTILAYYWNAWALARVQPSMVAVYVYLQPLIGFASAVVFLGERFTIHVLVAAVMVFTGVFLVTRRRPESDPEIHLTTN